MSEINDIVDIGFEGSCVVLFLVVSYKLYKMKCDTSSTCCKPQGENGVIFETHNNGDAGDLPI